MSVIVFGRYEELPDTPEWRSARVFSHTLLAQHANWWQPAYVKTILHGTERPLVPIFYRIHIARITGHQASFEPVGPRSTKLPMTDSAERSWLRRLVCQVHGKLRQ